MIWLTNGRAMDITKLTSLVAFNHILPMPASKIYSSLLKLASAFMKKK